MIDKFKDSLRLFFILASAYLFSYSIIDLINRALIKIAIWKVDLVSSVIAFIILFLAYSLGGSTSE